MAKPIPEGYFVLKTRTYRHWLLMRIFVKDGQTNQAVQQFKNTIKIYPLAQAESLGTLSRYTRTGAREMGWDTIKGLSLLFLSMNEDRQQ